MKSNLSIETDSPDVSVLIPDGDDWNTVKVLRCLGQMPTIKNHVLSRRLHSLAQHSRYCTSFHHNVSQNEQGWIYEINKLVKKHKIDTILPVTLRGVEIISKYHKEISEHVVLPPLAKSELIALANDKWSFHKFLILPYFHTGFSMF